MKLEKKVILDTYGLSALWFNDNFTQNEIKKIQQMHNKRIKLTLEIEQPILDEEERKYLSGVIKPFRDKINFVKKETYYTGKKTYEIIHFESKLEQYKDNTWLPPFEKDTMYKNMTLNKEYKLEDLGL